MTKQRPVLNILPIGWDYPGWVGEFYPDDLPAEWRLTYYANEFPGALIPQQTWTAIDTRSLYAWDADVGEGFRFYFLINQLVDPLSWAEKSDCLQERFGGFVVDSSCLQQFANTGVDCYSLFYKEITAEDVQLRALDKKRIAIAFSESDVTDLRRQRRFLEQIAEQLAFEAEVLLILQGDPPPLNKLRELQTLAQLLGLA